MAPNSRFTRYIDKISHCERRIENIKEWTNEVDAIEDERTRLATYKAMQEVVEGLMDLLAMILKDTKNLAESNPNLCTHCCYFVFCNVVEMIQ